MSLRIGPAKHEVTVDEGATVRLSGSVLRPDGGPAAMATVSLQTSPRGRHSWRTVASWQVPASGRLSATVHASSTADYRLRVQRSTTEAGSTSNGLARRTAGRARRRHHSHRRPGPHACGSTSRSRATPASSCVVQRWSRNALARRTPPSGSAATGDAVTVTVRAAKGELRFRFVKAPDATHLGAASKALQVRVV